MQRRQLPEGAAGRRRLASPERSPQFSQTAPLADLQWIWLTMLRHRALIIVCLCITVIPTVVYNIIAKPVYRATATIQIEPESAKILPYTDVSEPQSNPMPQFELYMKTQDEVLRSSELASRVASRLNGEEEGRRTFTAESLVGGVRVQRLEGSQLLRLSYEGQDPHFAANVANTWAEEFVKLHADRRYHTGERATYFLRSQLKNLKEKVEKAEADLIEFGRTHEILSIEGKQENAIRQRFGYLNGETSRAEKDLIASRAEYESLKKVTEDDFPEALKGPVVSSLEGKAFQVEQELVRLQAQFDAKWPAVVQKQNELRAVKSQLSTAKAAALARALKEAETHYNAALAEYNMLRNALVRQQALVDKLNRDSIQYNALRRELEASEQLYQGLLQRLNQVGVSAGLEISNVSVADRATPPGKAVRPRRVFSFSLAALLGLISGVGLSILLEYKDTTLRDPMEVEALGVPMLGWVPRLHAEQGPELESRGKLERGAGGNGVGAAAAGSALVKGRSQAQGREAYRSLCASILLSRGDRPPRTVLVTSAIPKEGKTCTTLELGRTLAEIAPPVLLVDADMRRPKLAELLGENGSPGLSTYLVGGPLVIEQTSTPQLSILPAGPVPPNPLSLLNAERMTELLTVVMEKYRFILFDSPPVLSAADASLLAPKMAGVVLVVGASFTPQHIVSRAVRQLVNTGCTMLGAVVNKVDLGKPGVSYYQMYYYSDDTEVAGRLS